ncbi:MAG: transposase [Prevotellaceae bacterium]|nr:transposase [Prevotellaceae bacterium]
MDSKIAQDSPVRLVNQVVDNLDISKIIDTYKGGGTSAYPPRVMLKIVIFAYLSNLYSCRKIEDAIKSFLQPQKGLFCVSNVATYGKSWRRETHNG